MSVADLRRKVEEKGYSAISVGPFGHAALKKFDYQLTKEHLRPSQGYTNEIHVYSPGIVEDGPVTAASDQGPIDASTGAVDHPLHRGGGPPREPPQDAAAVVMGVPVPAASEGASVTDAVAAAKPIGAMSLFEMVTELRLQLGLSRELNTVEAVEAAVADLGVDAKGKCVLLLAKECLRAIGYV